MSETTSTWLDAVDRPARETLRLARLPFFHSLAMLCAGGALASLASLAAELLVDLGQKGWAPPSGRILSAALEALVLVAPSALVLSAFFGLRIDARRLFAALAIGTLIAGVVTSATLPLFGYLTVVSRAKPMFTPVALMPVLAVAAVGATVGRVLEAVEDEPRGRWASIAFQLALYGLFAARCYAWFGAVS